jgi:hypothetical protein
MESPRVIRWFVGFVGGALIFFTVTLVSAFFLRNMTYGYPPFDVIVGVFVPLLIGLLAGAQSFRASVRSDKKMRSFRLYIGDRPMYPPGHCQNCGYNLTGNVSGICPECGRGIKR